MAQNAPSVDEGQRRRYRILMAVEAALEAALIVLPVSACALLPDHLGPSAKWPLVIVLTPLVFWHIVVIPLCFFYLIGNPIVMSLRPNATANTVAFRREVKKRQALTDEEFYARYYQDSAIPEHVPAGVRSVLLQLDPWMGRLIPTDRVYLLLDDDLSLDYALELIEGKFGIHFTEADYPSMDGTLGNLILMVHARTSPEFH